MKYTYNVPVVIETREFYTVQANTPEGARAAALALRKAGGKPYTVEAGEPTTYAPHRAINPETLAYLKR